jgi:hypothetical protein
MEEIKKVQCPSCHADFNSVNEIEEHIMELHCKFCGRKKPVNGDPLRPVKVLDTPEYETVVQRVKDRILESENKEKIDDIKGGFTPVLLDELVREASSYLEYSGPLTDREVLEYHNLHRSRTTGKICNSCLSQYEKIVDAVSED